MNQFSNSKRKGETASPVSCEQPALSCLCSADPSWSIPPGIDLSEASSRGTSVRTPQQNIQILIAQYHLFQQERLTGTNALMQHKLWQNKTDVQGEAVCKLAAEARRKEQLTSEQSPYCWIPPAADNWYWGASASRSVEDTRLETKLQNYPALVFAFLCYCNVADWPSLALNMMLSVLRIFLNQHWRVAARKVKVAVSQSCFCRKGDCLKGGLFDLSIFQICISSPRLCHSL